MRTGCPMTYDKYISLKNSAVLKLKLIVHHKIAIELVISV